MCRICGREERLVRARMSCRDHPNVIYLHDINVCETCGASQRFTELMEEEEDGDQAMPEAE